VKIKQIQEFEMYMKAKKLIVLKLEPKEEQAVFDFITKRKILSLADKTVLWKAIQLKCPLLTGDDKLRKEAKENGIEVHGTIWVILQLIEKKIVTKIKAVELLEELKIINTRLPVDEIDKLIKKLKL